MRHKRISLRSQEGGYSLVEVLVVVAIVGIISLVAVPQLVNFIRSNKLKSSLREVTNDVRAARQQAITGNRRTMVSFDTGTDIRKYRIYTGTTDSAGVTTYNLVARSASPTGFIEHMIEDGVYLETTNFVDANNDDGLAWNDVVFDSDGTINNVPTGQLFGRIVVKTVANIPKTSYTIGIYGTGRIKTF